MIFIVRYMFSSYYTMTSAQRANFIVSASSQVTGAGHGIGKELALKYASLKATVVCWDVNEQGNNETVNEIKGMGATKAYGYRCVEISVHRPMMINNC